MTDVPTQRSTGPDLSVERRLLLAAVRGVRSLELRRRLIAWLRSIPRDLPFATLLVGLAAAGWVLVVHSEGTWFWADDWDLLFLRGTIEGEDQGLLTAHNNHWFTAHVVVYRILFELFGLEYTAYVVMEVLFHLAVCLTLWLLLRRVGAGRWVAVGAALVVAWFGLGAGATIFPASLNHVGAVLMGMIALVVVLPRPLSLLRGVAALLCLLVSVMFGFTGLTMVVLVGLFVLLHHGLPRAVALGVPPLAVLGAWYLTYGRREGPNNSENFQQPIDVHALPTYVWKGLVDILGNGSGLAQAGPVLALLLVLAVLRPGDRPAPFVSLAWAGLVAGFVQLGIVAAARFHLGPDGIGSGHYAYIVLALLGPPIALAGAVLADYAGRPLWRPGLLAAALFVAYALHSVTLMEKWQSDFTLLTGGAKGLTLGVKKAHEEGQAVLSDRNPDIYNMQLKASYLTHPSIVPKLPEGEPTDSQLLLAQSYFFTTVREEQVGAFGRAEVRALSGLAPLDPELAEATNRLTPTTNPFRPRRPELERSTTDRPQRPRPPVLESGCHRFLSTAELAVLEVQTLGSGTEVVVFSDSGTVATRLYRDDLEGPLVEWQVEGDAAHVATSVPETMMLVSFDGDGPFTVCVG
ncbi:hypothetical protein [Nocardioides solisilvae]|uniref:hypothetical protein n=1 Tax=Nocardioides solisilvae TaxID=1542435 RepID=UPI0013A53E38|nr:hypothetical protein [Nocardioides solisilvae]